MIYSLLVQYSEACSGLMEGRSLLASDAGNASQNDALNRLAASSCTGVRKLRALDGVGLIKCLAACPGDLCSDEKRLQKTVREGCSRCWTDWVKTFLLIVYKTIFAGTLAMC